jgi:signal transduction histidine kinase
VRTPSIRTSLTLWFVGLTVALLVAFSATLYLGMRETLVTEFDARLQTHTEAVSAFCEWEPDHLAAEFDLPPEVAAEFMGHVGGRGVEVRAWPDGRTLYRSGLAIAAPLGDPAAGATLAFLDAGQETRVCTVRRPLSEAPPDAADREVVVRVAESFAPVLAQLQRVRAIIVLLTAVTALVVGAFGLLLSRRVVRPLRQLGLAAAAVDASTHTPMPRRDNGDEVDQLAVILDRTFASLRDALERKARFTADAAHELRNPVSVIRNAAEVALHRGRSEAELRQFLLDILETSKRMGDVVQSLLLLARMDAQSEGLALDEVDLAVIVREAVASCADGGRVALQDGAAAAVRGEPGLLRVLVDNLIGNALRHSEGARVEVGVMLAGGNVTLRVRDHGPGVPAEARVDVFRRFFRAKAPASCEGAGLGLSIVAAVAAAHGAHCRIEDANPGACVIVDFPALRGGAS